jgi:hypothetical protein
MLLPVTARLLVALAVLLAPAGPVLPVTPRPVAVTVALDPTIPMIRWMLSTRLL